MIDWKIGRDLYSLVIDAESGKCEIWTYRIRTMRRGRVYAILLASFTWGKVSTKSGDYGWLPNIPAWARRAWSADANPRDLFTTKLAALRSEIKTLDVDYFESQEAYDKAMRTLKGMETKHRPKKKEPK
jgi:hypothetical protein